MKMWDVRPIERRKILVCKVLKFMLIKWAQQVNAAQPDTSLKT